MLLDPERRCLFVHFIPRPGGSGEPETSVGGRNHFAGDIAVWEFAAPPPGGEAKPPVEPPAESPPAGAPAKFQLGDHLLGTPTLINGGRQLLVLCASTHRLLGIDTASFGTAWELSLDQPAYVVSVAPGQKTAFLASGRTILVVDLTSHKVTGSFDLDRDTWDLVALDEDRAVGSNDRAVWVLSASKQSVLALFDRIGGFMAAAPDDSRIFTGSGVFDRPAIDAKPFLGEPPGWSGGEQVSPSDALFHVTPGGRFLLESSGRLSRTGRSRLALRAPVEKLPPWDAAADLPHANQLILFRKSGQFDIWDLKTLSRLNSFPSESRVSAAVADEDHGVIYVHSCRTPSTFRIPHIPIRATVGQGDILKIPIPK